MKIKKLLDKPIPQCRIIFHSKRKYGEPLLSKPKQLKGIKQSFSVEWIAKKCTCPCYICGNDLYVKHRDFESLEIHNHSHEFRRRFVYNDSFGAVVLRGEAWIVLKDFVLDIENNVFIIHIFQNLAEQIVGDNSAAVLCEWERFFERVIKEYKNKGGVM